MATLTLLPDTGHHQQQQQQQYGHLHAKEKCTSATCCSPSRIWRSIQQLIANDNKQDLIKLCQDPNRATHVLRVILSSRLTNDASLYPASNKHRVIQLLDDGSSGLSPLHYRATVKSMFGKTATDLNPLQLALFHRKESIACYILQSVRQYAGDKEMKLFVNHLWGESNGSLHLACFLGMPRVVQLLLEMGVAPDSVNRKGKTPLDCCVDMNASDGGQASVLDCRTLIEQALLIKQGKKLSVDSSSSSVGVAAPEQNLGHSTTTTTCTDGDTNKDENRVDDTMVVDIGAVDSPMNDGDMDFSSGQGEMWSLPLLLMDSPFDSDAFASEDDDEELFSPPLPIMDTPFALDDAFTLDDGDDGDEAWSPPLLIMDSPFATGDAFASEEVDELWSPPLLIMDNPFDLDPFVSEDDGTDGSTCLMDDDGLQPISPKVDSHEQCSVDENDLVYSVTGDYSDYGYDGDHSSGTSSIPFTLSGGGHGKASVPPPTTLDGGTHPAVHSPLLFGMNSDPDPKTHDNHQPHFDPKVSMVAPCLHKQHLDPTIVDDISWLDSNHYGGTGDTRNRSLLYSFVKQFKANDWKALCHDLTLLQRNNPAYDLMNVLTGVNDDSGDQDNPNTMQLLSTIICALNIPTRSHPLTPFYQCNSDYRTILGSHGLNHYPSLMVGGDT